MKKWSVFVYICADNPDRGLFDAALANIGEMRKVGSNESVGVVAQVDLPAVPTKRYVFPQNTATGDSTTIQVTELDGNINSADPANIVDFFKWANEKAPAEKTFLILWGHGFGIDDFDPFVAHTAPAGTKGRGSEWAGFPDFHVAFPPMHAPIQDFTSALPESLPDGLPDATSGTLLQNKQIAGAIADCGKALGAGQRLEILGFDACDMSLLEVWFEITNPAPMIGIGSQFGIPFKGWPYTNMLKHLLGYPDSTPAELAKQVVAEFADFNDANKAKPVVTLAACNLGLAEELAATIKTLAAALAKESVSMEGRARIFNARNESPIFDEDGFIDVETFCRLLQTNIPDAEISAQCEAVCEAVQKYVIAHSFAPKNTTKKISLSTGVSLWFPPWIQHPDIEILEKKQSEAYFHRRYPKTRFAQLTGWDVFLKTILVNTRFKSENDMQHEEDMMPDSEDDQNGAGDKGKQTEGMGKQTEGMGKQTSGFGRQTPGFGKQAPGFGRQTPTAGKNESAGGMEPGGRVFLDGSSREAGVVVRATVESFGPVGETELHVTVKWPAGCNSSPVVEQVKKSSRPAGGDENVD